MSGPIGHTSRGFSRHDFTDTYGIACSIQKSSAASEDRIWLGCDDADPQVFVPGRGWQALTLPPDTACNTRMHLSREQAAKLATMLDWFAKHGNLPEEVE